MTMPESLQPGLYGATLETAAMSLIGFNWAGWVTAAGAEKQAATCASVQVATALAPVYLERSRSDTASKVKLETLRMAPLAIRPDLLMKIGWATPPGIETAARDLSRACLEALAVAAP